MSAYRRGRYCLFLWMGLAGTSKTRMSKDKGSTLCFYVWVLGTATRKNIKHNEQKSYPVHTIALLPVSGSTTHYCPILFRCPNTQ